MPGFLGVVAGGPMYTAGWIAHTLEEYGEAPLRYRARALFTGPDIVEEPTP